jgi:hypothetical protein
MESCEELFQPRRLTQSLHQLSCRAPGFLQAHLLYELEQLSHRNDEKSTLIILKSQQEPSGIDWTGSKFDVWLVEIG